ncbi:MAG: tetratricopeptide repeat protein, partial [Myxococcaceae bacterium]
MPAPAVFLLLLLVGSASGPGQEEPAAPRPARIGVTLAPGASRSIPVPLRRGEFARLEVLQPGARLTLTLLAPDGATVAENANPTEDDEPLPLSVIAPRGGTFTLLLALDPSTTSPVVVTVVLEPPRPASATDPVRIEAERLFAEGQRRRAEGTKEALGAALALDLRTAEKAGQAGDTLREAYARAEAAEVHWLQGELRLAREEGIRSVGLWRTLGRKKQLAAALNDLGAFERDLEETQAALEHYGEALRLGREIGDRRLEAALLHNIGGVYGLLREHRRAIDFLRQALAIKRRLHWHEAVTLDVLGMEYHGLRDFQTSLRYHREVLEMRRRSGDLRGQAITLTNMGWNLDDLGQRPQALALFRQAQALAERVGDRRQEAILLDSTGKTLAALGRADEALDCHQKALALSREIGDPEEQVYALEDSARVLLGLGRPAEALPRIEEALAITEETRTRIAATEHRAAYSAHARERYDLLVDILWTLHQADPTAGHDARALQVSERARARGLLDLLAETRTDLREGMDPALLERERAASAALEQLATEQAAQVSGGKASPEALEEKSQRLAVDLDEIRGLIRAHSPRYAELVFPQPKGLEAIQRSLDGETLLLEYHLAEGRSFVWAVGPTTRVL